MIATGPSLANRWASLAVLTMAVLLLAIDATVLALAVPAITEDLGASSTQVLWIGDVYSLALAGLLVVMGNLGDRVGRKRLLLLGAFAFGGASLLAALATTPEMLIGARVLLGIAGATIMPSTLSLIRNIFDDPTERTRAIAIWTAAASGGAAMGPIVGGALLEHFWWGSVFLINVPVMVLLVVGGAYFLPESKDPNPGRFDAVSALLSFAAIIFLVYAIKHTATTGLDINGTVCAVTGIALGFWFVRRQRSLADPMIDVDLFRNTAFSGAVFATFIAVLSLSGLMFFFSQYLQLVRGMSPLEAGIAELPATLAAVSVVVFAGWFLAKLGRGRAIATGLLMVSVGLFGVAAAEGLANYAWLALALFLIGAGVGLSHTLTTDAVVSAVRPDRAGRASAISETAYELGVALGIAILGSLTNVLYRAALAPAAHGEHLEDVRDSLASAARVLAPGSPAAADATAAFTVGMQTTSVVAASATLIAAVVALRTIPSEGVKDN